MSSLIPPINFVSAPNSYLPPVNLVSSSLCIVSILYSDLQKIIKTNEDFNTEYNLLKVQYDSLKKKMKTY